MRLVSRQLLCAVSEPHRYDETAVTLDCAGHGFAAKGKIILVPGWKAYLQEQADKPLPELTEGQSVPVSSVSVKEGKTSPPKHYTEDICYKGRFKKLPKYNNAAAHLWWMKAGSRRKEMFRP